VFSRVYLSDVHRAAVRPAIILLLPLSQTGVLQCGQQSQNSWAMLCYVCRASVVCALILLLHLLHPQMGVHCGELCKCSDCKNIDNGDGLAAPGSAAKAAARSNPRANSSSSQKRLQHTTNLATLGSFWQLGQQGLGSAVSSGAGTPVAAAAAAAASAGFGAMAGLTAQAGQTSE
jgi:hypothetical protein